MLSEPKKQEFDWGHMLWLMDAGIDPAATFSAAKMVLLKGKTSDHHLHDNCSEFIFVDKGAGEVLMDGRIIPLKSGTGILVPANTPHAIRNCGPGPLELSLTYSAGKRNYTPCEGT